MIAFKILGSVVFFTVVAMAFAVSRVRKTVPAATAPSVGPVARVVNNERSGSDLSRLEAYLSGTTGSDESLLGLERMDVALNKLRKIALEPAEVFPATGFIANPSRAAYALAETLKQIDDLRPHQEDLLVVLENLDSGNRHCMRHSSRELARVVDLANMARA
jgi:hypothetical protein